MGQTAKTASPVNSPREQTDTEPTCIKCGRNHWLKDGRCATCTSRERSRAWALKNKERTREIDRKRRLSFPERELLAQAKLRAKRNGLEFNIDRSDIVIPYVCPLLGMVLEVGRGVGGACDASPSLDRIDPTKGYIKGNVWVISYRANTLKRDALLSELEMLVTNLRKKVSRA